MTAERLFLALWPDTAVRTALAPLAISVIAHAGRAVPPENLHLTLVFLGAVDAARRACVEHACARVRADAFELTLAEVRAHRSGIVWAAPVDTPEALRELVDQLRTTLGQCGLVPEARRFRAHVTLARDVRRPILPRQFSPILWNVREFGLGSSRLGRGGSSYTVERRWPLGAGAPA